MHGHHGGGFSIGHHHHHGGFGHHHHHIGHHHHHHHMGYFGGLHHHHRHNVPVVIPMVISPNIGVSRNRVIRSQERLKLKNPSVPLNRPFPHPLTIGSKLKLKGRAVYHKDDTSSFVIILGHEQEIQLRLEFNHKLRIVTVNSCIGGVWSEVKMETNRVEDGKSFKISIKPEKTSYRIKINGYHFHYSQPIYQSPQATFVEVSGGVELGSLKVQNC